MANEAALKQDAPPQPQRKQEAPKPAQLKQVAPPESDDAAEGEEIARAPGHGRRKLFILAGALALAAGGAGTWFALRMESAPESAPEAPKKGGAVKAAAKTGAAKAAAKNDPAKPPQFVNLETFTVNLRDDGSAEHYLQIGLVFQVTGPEVAEAMKLHMPIIRSSILLLLSSRTASELATLEGKQKLAQDLLAAARAPLPGDNATRGIGAVHFASLIVQ